MRARWAAAAMGTAALLWLTPGCGDHPAAPEVFDDPARPIVVAAGQQFVVALQSNASTGYSWRMAAEPDPRTVQLVDHSYLPPPEGSGVGAPGAERWVFRGVAPGQATIQLEYVRPWETGVPPAQTAVFTVRVR
jgi:inhibitor of cysteine peptidase